VPDPKTKKSGLMVVGVGDQSTQIKACLLTQDEKIQQLEQCGELIDRVINTSYKYLVQSLDRSGSDGRAAMITLNSSQRDISILELM
jgi:pyridoxal/pyridoxine/pyridoxamine kinase